MTFKKISQASLIGQKGVNLIEKIVLDMGLLWHPSQVFDAGIDGVIEVRDSITGEVTNSIIQVQSKATTKEFQAETEYGFDYTCDERDLDYWLRGNAPVILVVSRPDTDEAYWISIKDYFATSDRTRSRKIHFDKRLNRFNSDCKAELISLALPKDAGIYFAPPIITETLYSNLLRVSQFPERIYVARTEFRTRRELWEAVEQKGVSIRSEWTIRANNILSFNDFDTLPWNELCDLGTIESFDADSWAYSHDKDRRSVFVELLHHCLRAKVRRWGLRYSKKQECYFFEATADLRPRLITYQSITNKTTRTVFRGYPNAHNAKYYRHSAFKARFQLYDNAWYLEIIPTYYFTWDGYKADRFYEDRLKGIKRLESNAAVLGQLIMWGEYLSREDLIEDQYQLLKFDRLMSFNIDSGVNEKAWLHNEASDTKKFLTSTEQLLF